MCRYLAGGVIHELHGVRCGDGGPHPASAGGNLVSTWRKSRIVVHFACCAALDNAAGHMAVARSGSAQRQSVRPSVS